MSEFSERVNSTGHENITESLVSVSSEESLGNTAMERSPSQSSSLTCAEIYNELPEHQEVKSRVFE